MSEHRNFFKGQVEIPISEDGDLSEKSNNHGKEKSRSTLLDTILGRPNFSATSLHNELDEHIEKFDIFTEKVEEHRTLQLIDKEDQNLYNEINNWVEKNPGITLEETILKYDPEKYPNSDALAKVVHDYPFPDFILKYENDKGKHLYDNEKDNKEKNAIRAKKRQNFECLLLRAGLVLEHEIDTEGNHTYVKIIAPFDRLCEQAQQTKIKIRLNDESLPKDLSIFDTSRSRTIFSKIKEFFSYKIDLKKESSVFKKDRLKKFKGAESQKNIAEISLNFFTTARRNLLVHRMIITANQINKKVVLDNGRMIYVKRKIDSLAISKLLKAGVYDKFYPIHDGLAKIKSGSITSPEELEKYNLRAQLNELWVKSHRKQPIEKIREYFGEKFALYFVWLGFYTSWLSIASLAGLIVVIYGVIDAAIETSFTSIKDVSVIWDNALTAPYTFLMAVWATCFLESWKRANASIQYDWDVVDFEREELPRPEFYGTRIVIVTVGVLIIFPIHFNINPPKLRAVITASVNLATIIILNIVYRNVAKYLTHFENHKTQTQFEDSLILKAYLFDFINFYSALVYILLFKQHCEVYVTCMNELTIQLAIIFIGKQMIGQVQEVLIPWLMSKWYKTKNIAERDELQKKYEESNRKHTEVPQWVHDDNLTNTSETVRTEYEEIVIQFGFITLFGTAFPLAPLFAWINNMTEIRSDAFKVYEPQEYIKTFQRPVGSQAQDLGMWENIMSIVSLISVVTNAIIIAFHSSWMHAQFDKYTKNSEELLVARLGFVLAFEHLVFIIKLIFAYMIPDIPRTVKVAIERERYLTRLTVDEDPPALDEYWSEDKDDSSLFSVKGTLLLPSKTPTGGNIIKDNA
ncbi:12376_t:CDS:10 [Funneliformis geosporum]|uniref:12376_t:CDS:1 n=1 Tax=Funneliformis geosporum TaxID=1117311 RepID=A0A9W4SEV3_9GLOM|nr:12376_t:CDS:10 [Funneliformis geosporum]